MAIKAPYKCFLKAYFLDIYRNNNQIACYNFCQQYNNHFAITGAKGSNCIPFAIFFRWDCISFRWQKHKHKLDSKSLVFLSWTNLRYFYGRAFAIWRVLYIISSVKLYKRIILTRKYFGPNRLLEISIDYTQWVWPYYSP